jgi:release factor glutamine methyltransferase
VSVAVTPNAMPDTERKSAGEKVWTVLELLRWTTGHFESRGIESARLDAEVLLAFALGVERIRLYVDFEKPVMPPERAVFRELVKRRAGAREPVSHLVGGREFWSLEITVTPDVLTPRPDTETLVGAALELLPGQAEGCAPRVLDIGTGSGAIALAIASERPDAGLVATDVSPAALKVARDNASKLDLAARIDFREGSLFAPVLGERFDLIVSNPPYLAEGRRDELPPELAYEPEVALFAGEDGLDVLRALVDGVGEVLTPEGSAAFEISPEQAPAVESLLREAGFTEVRCHRDLAQRKRVVAGRWGRV